MPLPYAHARPPPWPPPGNITRGLTIAVYRSDLGAGLAEVPLLLDQDPVAQGRLVGRCETGLQPARTRTCCATACCGLAGDRPTPGCRRAAPRAGSRAARRSAERTSHPDNLLNTVSKFAQDGEQSGRGVEGDKIALRCRTCRRHSPARASLGTGGKHIGRVAAPQTALSS